MPADQIPNLSRQKRNCYSIMPQFRVPDAHAAAEWYRDKLGFKIQTGFNYVAVYRDGIAIRFIQSSDIRQHEMTLSVGDIYILVDNGVADLRETFLEQGVTCSCLRGNWEMLEFVAVDLNGYELMFAENTQPLDLYENAPPEESVYL